MEAYVKPPKTGLEAFQLMPEGTLCQLINDNLIMSPAPTPIHQEISGIIYQQLVQFVRSNKLGKVLYSPIDVYLNPFNVYQPDIVFVSKEKEGIIDWRKGILGVPDLVIEVLSKGNRNYDLNDKKLIYQQSGVNEYWVSDPESKWCEGFVVNSSKYNSSGESNGELIIRMFDLKITI